MTSELLKQAQRAGDIEDQTQTTSFGDYEPAPEGLTPARLIKYVELGTQPRRPFKGQAKDPAAQVYIEFELLGEKHLKQIEVDGVKKTIKNKVSLTMVKSNSDKSTFKKLFKSMTYGRKDITHMAQMVSEVFMLTIEHNESNGKTYVNIQDNVVNSPIRDIFGDDGVTVVRQIDVTEKVLPVDHDDLALFLFEGPTMAQWDSIYREGTYEVKTKDDKGNEVTEEKSKNWMQERIQSALNWEGSDMHTLLMGITEEEAPKDTTVKEEKPKAEPKAKAKETPVETKEEESSEMSEEEYLKSIGL